jgi:hypothetical protein
VIKKIRVVDNYIQYLLAFDVESFWFVPSFQSHACACASSSGTRSFTFLSFFLHASRQAVLVLPWWACWDERSTEGSSILKEKYIFILAFMENGFFINGSLGKCFPYMDPSALRYPSWCSKCIVGCQGQWRPSLSS